MAKLDPAIRHAITPVAFDENKLHRERLVDAIHAEIQRKLIVISAPAGYGKTTLLADFTSHTDIPVCWVRLTQSNQDVMTLADTVLSSVRTRFRRLKSNLDLSRFATTPPEGLARAIGANISAKIPETFALVFDDVEFVSSSQEAVRFIDGLIESTPVHTKFILCGREVLEVSLARLMANGELAALGPHDLALTNEEATALAETFFPESEINFDAGEISSDLRGWVTGMVLSLQSGAVDLGRGISGPQDIIYNYFASTVLNRTSDDLRKFMLQSSVMPVLSAEAVDEILARNDSKAMIQSLANNRVFVHQTNALRGEYEYHPLFRKFLNETFLAMDEDLHREITRRAASHFAKAGSVDWAVNLFITSGSLLDAALHASHAAPELFARGRFETIYKWLDDLRVLEEPLDDLRLWAASAYLEQGRHEEVLRIIADLRERLEATDCPVGRTFRAHVFEGFASLRMGDLHTAEKAIAKLENLYKRLMYKDRESGLASVFFRLKSDYVRQDPRGNLEEAKDFAMSSLHFAHQSGQNNQIGQALHQVSLLQSLTGDFLEALANGRKAIDILRRYASPASLAGSLNNQAVRSFRQGEYEQALELLQEARGEARLASSRTIEATILISQAEIFNDIGMIIQAGELFEEGLQLAVETSDSYLILEACVGSATLHRRNGTMSMGSKWLERALSLRVNKIDISPPEVQIERAALELAATPAQSVETISDLISGSTNLDSYLYTKALFVRLHALHLLNNHNDLSSEAEACLNVAIGTGSEQIIAAECLAQQDLWENIKQECPNHPAISTITQRIDSMNSISSRWGSTDDPAEEPEAEKIRVFAMGGSQVQTGHGISIAGLKPQGLELLYFLVDNQISQREGIIAAFWPNYSSGRQTANLHMAVYSLRQALGKDAIILDGVAYRLDKTLIEYYDVAEFERSARVAEMLPDGDPRRLFALTDAISRYHGPFLIEYESQWVEERRRLLDQRYMDLVANHADEILIRDNPAKALQSLRMALEIDPYRDDLNLRYLRVLDRLGRRSEIVSHFDRYRRLIQSDLGLDPPALIRDEYRQMIN